MTGLLDAAGIVVDHVPDGWLEEDVLLLVTAGYPAVCLGAVDGTGLTPEATMRLLRTVHTLVDHVTPQQMGDLVVARHSPYPDTTTTTWVRDILTAVDHCDATTLVDAPDQVVAALLAGHPTTSTDHLRELLAYASDPTLLTHLAGDPMWSVRAGVADNPTTTPDVLTTLAGDPNEYVRADVAGNPTTPPDVLTTLAKDHDRWVRQAVADNPTTPPDVLTTLTGDPDSVVRKRAAGRFPLAV